MSTTTHKSACILCSLNCGIEVAVDQEKRELVSIKGDKEHPVSKGYICQKATRLNYYQNQERLTSPLRKKEDGSFEAISWDVAIQEIAAKMVAIRDTHGGETIAYAGGGGQGNHLGGVYAATFRAACKTPYIYSSIAQEKTGNFWVHGKLFGRQNTFYAEPVADAQFVMIIGANPIQSHGIVAARKVINAISRDKNRTLVVVDPRETETAKKADEFMQVKPGRDAWLMAAMLGIIVQEGLENKAFIKEHTVEFEEIRPYFLEIPTKEYAVIAGVPFEQVERVTKALVAAETAVIRSDLGIEMSYNSTLNAYLKRLLFLITGHFGKHGTNHMTTGFFPLLGHSRDPEEGGLTTQVTKMRGIGKLFPPNILPLEIDNEHPKRVRALFVDSSNPVVNWADSKAQVKAYKKLDLMVVVDIAMTETAQEAHYVLPASSQFEKFEAAFFGENFFHLRRPFLEPLEGTLSEPEIYTRLIKAMGVIPEDLSELKEAAEADRATPGKGIFQMAFMKAAFENAGLKRFAPAILRETLGKALPYGADAAGIIWMTAQMYAQKYPDSVRRAGIEGNTASLGTALFEKILESPSGVITGVHSETDQWDLIRHPDKKIHLSIPELLEWLVKLPEEDARINALEAAYPFNLIAGERRAYNANAIFRNPAARKMDAEGSLKINSADAAVLGINTGDTVKLTSATGSIHILTRVFDEVPQGVLSMPHGHGLKYGGSNDFRKVGALVNQLTSTGDCDPLAKTPYHKNVRVRLEKVG
jgi:anaerobic selenocysteine-containing dehydrogenase